MKPDKRFRNKDKSFWAVVRTISQEVGYTIKRKKQVKVPTETEISDCFQNLNLDVSKIVKKDGTPTTITRELIEYFNYRAQILNSYVEPKLMDVEDARKCFNDLYHRLRPNCHIPMNKQKGDKKTPAYLTGIVNMIIESKIGDITCDYNPKELTTITKNGFPIRTLARRIDGAFPSPINPIAVWEIKEYYYTTTFGSRVADGVYETLLDGMELEDLQVNEKINVLHYLILDSHYTWWECGRSYLCRIIDMLHMGYVDEVLFGREVIERLPDIVLEWVEILKTNRP